MSSLQMKEAHYPERIPIDAYGNGGFRFANSSHRGSLLCLPSGIYSWWPKSVMPLSGELERVFLEAAQIEVLLVGTGETLVPLPLALRQELRALGISADSMSTGAAVRTYNVLLAEERAVAACLYAI